MAMRVGLVCPYSLSVSGGVQGQVLGLARSLRSMGHSVRVLAPCDGPPPDAGVTPLGRSIPVAANGSIAPIAPDPSCALRTMRALADERFDVLHLHEPFAPGPTITSLLAARSPMVGTFHQSGLRGMYRAGRPLARRLARRLAVRCAVSPEALSMVEGPLGGDFELVFNGIELDKFAKATPWPTDLPTIVFLGRHEPRKGLEVLLRAMSWLPDDIRLWVLGAGEDTGRLRAAYGHDERIEWLGRVSDEEVASRLRGADVFCAPNRFGESFGIILLEAMAAHTPIVASDLPGFRLVARPETEAVLVQPDDPEGLADALRRVLTDPRLGADLAIAGDRRSAEFSMDHLAERYVELYQTAISA